MLNKLKLLLATLLLSVSFTYAQTGRGTIKGSVIDKKTKEELPFVKVVVYQNGVQKGYASTDFTGGFIIPSLEPGEYDIEVKFIGYNSIKEEGVVEEEDSLIDISSAPEQTINDNEQKLLYAEEAKGLGFDDSMQEKYVEYRVGGGDEFCEEWHAGLVAEYILEDLVRIPVEVEYASEFKYRNPIITSKDVVIAISQSGETADTLAAIQLAQEKGAFVFGVCNVVGSTISRVSHAGAYTHAGPEIGVASTKAFTTQITVLSLIALRIAKAKESISVAQYKEIVNELELIPQKVEIALLANQRILEIAHTYKTKHNCLYLGRGVNFPVALEGALKLKEISYIHAEGYPAAEMKHGPIALIDENMPVIVVAINKGHYDKTVSNIQEIKSRKGKIIAIVTEGDTTVRELADHVIEVPETLECLSPLVTTIPLQLLSYHMAVLLNKNVDQPRNLAKSVTVE